MAVPQSPSLLRLAARVRAGDEGALRDFWSDVGRQGAPLVDEDAGRPDGRLVTFVWRDDGQTVRAQAMAGPVPFPPSRDDLFERLEGTDVWHRTYRVRQDFRGLYRLVVNDALEDPAIATREDLERMDRAAVPDPLNPRTQSWPPSPADPGSPARTLSVLELPDAPPETWYPEGGGAPGPVTEVEFDSRILKNRRRIWFYHSPARAGESAEPALAIVFDGHVWANVLPIAPTLDRLRADGRLPPLVVVMVDALENATTRMRELGLDPGFADFLDQELLPFIEERFGRSFAAKRTVVAGQSLGGLTAAHLGLRRPDLFGNVLSQSGSFWWKCDPMTHPGDTMPDDPQSEQVVRAYQEASRLPRKVWMEVGLYEGGVMLGPNRRLHDTLVAKGCPVRYSEFAGAHDFYHWKGTLAEGLCHLLDSR